jgi:hypothetical protein
VGFQVFELHASISPAPYKTPDLQSAVTKKEAIEPDEPNKPEKTHGHLVILHPGGGVAFWLM